ncbi:hypothetical protein [Yersinia frederiksenii]|uniref:hypothetical protein n=1 Tax=Yersinia frederiksenii TaxID=29484 RepID=UPI00100BDB81|nr:hypothetical protein [Yersinia frederiksenii]HEC1651077.1 hypothetical protein [Yersinia enterocolitica]HEI6964576.1 hypothetical protein [Yersinia enterocolitica]
MKRRIQCIAPSEAAVGYITAGKWYDIESTSADGQCVRIIDDQGDEVSILMGRTSYGEFTY